jgi:hypothetical protein
MNWDEFDSRFYCAHNYQTLRADDRQIVAKVRDFFATVELRPGARGLDMGPGANLYPSLAMLPFCETIDLREMSAANVRWLTSWSRVFDRRWRPFWDVYAQNPVYRQHTRYPRLQFRRKAQVTKASVFDPDPNGRKWQIGTMFFVACSLSTEEPEFYQAVECFLDALEPNAPFAIGFMTNSHGYQVADKWFPAVPVDEKEIRQSLKKVSKLVALERIETADPLRPEVGMMLATGRA